MWAVTIVVWLVVAVGIGLYLYWSHYLLVIMQLHSGPDNSHFGIRRAYEEIIAQAQNYVYIQTPYLIPGDSILEALIIAAKVVLMYEL